MGYSFESKKVLQLPLFFKKNLKESNHKPTLIWLDKIGEFYNSSNLKENLLLLKDLLKP